MFFKNKKVIGLDIGTCSIKIAEIEVSRKSSTIVSFGMIQTPMNAIVGGEIVDPVTISDSIRSIITELKIKCKAAATGLWGASVVVKKINIPQMEESLIGEQLRWEAEQYIPYELSEVNLDYHVTNANGVDGGMEVLLVAARHDHILNVAEIVEASSLNCALLDIQGFSLANCFQQNYPDLPEETVALLNIGGSSTNFVVIEGGRVIFCRDIPIGGSVYTSEIQKELNLTFPESEALKLSASMGKEAPTEVTTILKATHDSICDEIHGSLDFFMNTTPGAKVGKFFLTGGASQTPQLIERLSEATGIACESFNPFNQISCSKKMDQSYMNQVSPFAAVAVGLGLRKLGDS